MYKITITELEDIKRSLYTLTEIISFSDEDIMHRTLARMDKRIIEAKRIIKSLEENYNIK
jgi:hypothetical protein